MQKAQYKFGRKVFLVILKYFSTYIKILNLLCSHLSHYLFHYYIIVVVIIIIIIIIITIIIPWMDKFLNYERYVVIE